MRASSAALENSDDGRYGSVAAADHNRGGPSLNGPLHSPLQIQTVANKMALFHSHTLALQFPTGKSESAGA